MSTIFWVAFIVIATFACWCWYTLFQQCYMVGQMALEIEEQRFELEYLRMENARLNIRLENSMPDRRSEKRLNSKELDQLLFECEAGL